MGKEIVKYWKKRGGKKQIFPILTTFILGLLIHGYKFTNTLLNHDGVYNFYSDQNVLGSGRWFLSIACGISSYFDLPWVIGILSLIYIAITVAVIVSIFRIENRFVIVLISGLMVSFPAVTETFFFGFTADGYMLAMLMAAMAVWLTGMENQSWKRRCLAAGLICLCCGIYQAYVSFAMVLALLYLMYELLENRYTLQQYGAWIRSQLVIYISGLLSYFVIWKVCMYIQDVPVNDYQGIAEVGTLSFSLILGGFVRTIQSILLFFLEWNVFEHGFTLYAVLNVLFIICFLLLLVLAVKKSRLWERKIPMVLFLLCLAAVPIASCIWHFTSSSVGYRPMMLYSLCLIYIFAVILCDRYLVSRWTDVFAGLIFIIIFNFALQANISYFYMNQCYEKSHAMGAEMMARIHLLDDGSARKIAVVGNVADKAALGIEDEAKQIHMMGQLLEKYILFDQVHTVLFLENTYDLTLEAVDAESLERLEMSKEVEEMGCWPAADSICLSGDTIILKLADRDE